MQCVSDLAKLKAAVLRRIVRLESLWANHASEERKADPATIAFVTIELDNAIVAGLKQYSKSCLLGCRTASGRRVSSSAPVSRPEQAAALILSRLNRQRFEELGEPSELEERFEYNNRQPHQWFSLLSSFCDNLDGFYEGMSYNGKVFNEIGSARNFFAHRNASSAERFAKLGLNLGLGRFHQPEDILLSVRKDASVSVYESWVADARNFFEVALN